MRRFVILGLGSVLFGGCGILGLDTKIRIGVLFPHDPGALERVFVVQDSVMVGESFTVAVYTVGSGRCTRVVRHPGRHCGQRGDDHAPRHLHSPW